jgi:hypothetical protein
MGGRECLTAPASPPDKQLQRSPHSNVVIDNKHDRRGIRRRRRPDSTAVHVRRTDGISLENRVCAHMPLPNGLKSRAMVEKLRDFKEHQRNVVLGATVAKSGHSIENLRFHISKRQG